MNNTYALVIPGEWPELIGGMYHSLGRCFATAAEFLANQPEAFNPLMMCVSPEVLLLLNN